MTERAVHWHEGMFLLPQHFQLASRHVASVSHLQTTYALHHYWGLRAIDLDADALAASRFVVRSLKARLLDGTAVELPADGVLPPLELKPALEKQSSVTVYLALPVFNLNQPNASDSADPHSRRFRVESVSLPDENTGTDPQAVQVRLLNLRLLVSGEDRAGYETIPLARIVRSARAEALPELDRSYIPPLLACDAWAVLQREILQSIAERLTQKIDLLATQLVTRNVGIDSSGADGLLIAQLRQLNEAQATLHVVAYTPGIHPLAAFLELCRIVGQLAFLGPTRRAAELPRYDHDDLGRCFWRLKQLIDELLDVVVEPDYKERAFVGAGTRMQVTLEPAWVEPAWQMYIGVQGSLTTDETITLLTKPGQLDMKVGSSERVDGIFRLGQAGLRFAVAARPPRVLPNVPGQVYFQLSRDTAPQGEWLNVQRSLTLAIRLNENLIAGDIQGQRTLHIRSGASTSTMQFTLYVVPQRLVQDA